MDLFNFIILTLSFALQLFRTLFGEIVNIKITLKCVLLIINIEYDFIFEINFATKYYLILKTSLMTDRNVNLFVYIIKNTFVRTNVSVPLYILI